MYTLEHRFGPTWEYHAQGYLVLITGGDHRVSIFKASSDRFLYQHMLASLRGSDRLLGMLSTWSANTNYIHLRVGEQFSFCLAGDTEAALDVGKALRVIVAHGNQSRSIFAVGSNGLGMVLGDHASA
jgi:hypothetical protein